MFGRTVKVGRARLKVSGDALQKMMEYLVGGLPAPPPEVLKLACIAHYQELTGYQLFVETGTYLGDTLAGAARIFRHCYSVELSPEFYRRAQSRFARCGNITLEHGSSAQVLPRILGALQEPAIIWLDAHYSGGVTAGEGNDPLEQELGALPSFKEMRHLIMIDDARGLGVTQQRLQSFVEAMGPEYHASLLHDSVRVVPREVPLLGEPLTAAQGRGPW